MSYGKLKCDSIILLSFYSSFFINVGTKGREEKQRIGIEAAYCM
jgi:hypothetical protein